MITLAEHVDLLAASRADWLRDTPADFPAWQRSAFEAVRPTWLEQAAVIEAEINDAIRALRRHGFLPGPGEMGEHEQSAGVLSEGEAAPS